MITIEACHNGQRCPYLENIDIFSLKKDYEYFKARVLKLELKLAQIEKECQELRQEKASLEYQLKRFRAKLFKPRVKPSPGQTKQGAPVGHPGGGRKRPAEISEEIKIYPRRCDKCGSEIKIYENKYDKHVVEDIVIKKKTSCYRFHYGYCPRCQRVIYPKAKERASIIPYDRIGSTARAVGSYLRYIGIPYRKVENIFRDVFGLEITHSSFLAFNTEQAQHGVKVYEALKEAIRNSSYVHGDETGWRVKGENWWLWVFTNKDMVLYQIDKRRSSEVVEGVLGKRYQGVLSSDFYSAYNKIIALAKQRCVGHLLDKIKQVQEKNKFTLESIEGRFCEGTKQVLKHTIEVWNDYHKGIKTIEDLACEKAWAITRMVELLSLPTGHKDIQGIRKRIIRHNQELFTFLDYPEVEPTNNRAERQLRPSVIMRKITFGNRSLDGVESHQIITSIIHTGLLQGIKPLNIFKVLAERALTSLDELPRPP